MAGDISRVTMAERYPIQPFLVSPFSARTPAPACRGRRPPQGLRGSRRLRRGREVGLAAAEPGIEDVAEGVAEDIEAKDGEGDTDTGEDGEAGVGTHVL